MNKYLVLSLLLSAASNNSLKASWNLNSFFNKLEKEVQSFQEEFRNLESETNFKTEKLDNVNLKIEQNKDQIIIKLDIENLKADQLKELDVKNNVIYGNIATSHGLVNLAITKNFIEVAQRSKVKAKNKNGEEKEYLSQFWSSRQATTLPAKVNLKTAKAELQGNTLLITIDKEAPEKIAIKNNKLAIKQNNQSKASNKIAKKLNK